MKPLYKALAFICVLNALFSTTTYGQANCNNVDFENGDFTGWQGFYGNWVQWQEGCCDQNSVPDPGDPISPRVGLPAPPAPAQTMARHTIMSGAGFDPRAPAVPVVSPFGGTYSVLLGDRETGGHSAKITYDYLVTAQNPNFTYHYAVVLQDGGSDHDQLSQPKFLVKITNAQNNQVISCGKYRVFAGPTIPGFQNAPNSTPAYPFQSNIKFKNWSMVAVDLTSYIGQTINISFEVSDCAFAGHLGYAYIDASCNPMQISTTYCPGDPAATLTAPPGFESYLWSTGQTTESIVVTNPVPGQTITVVAAPFQGGSCSSTLQYTFLQSPPVEANFTADVSCGNSAIVLTDSSTIVASGAQITGWEWIINNTVVSTNQSFTHSFPGPGQYPVTIISKSNAGCPDTITRTIDIPQGLDIVMATPSTSSYNGFGVSCHDAANGTVSVTASYGTAPYTYAWNTTPPSTNPTVNNLPAGTYYVTVTEVGGCEAVDSAVLTAPPAIVIAPTAIDVQCYGETTGSIALNATGGTGTLSYRWQHNATLNSPNATGITGGTYAFTITDGNGCTFDSSIVINSPAAPYAFTGNGSTTTCFGGCDGTAELTNVTGNTSPYTYLWGTTPQQTTTQATGLCAGTYTVTVTDANNCTSSVSYVVNEPPQLQLGLTKTDLFCNGDNSGTASTSVSGGVTPYTYIWSDANASSTSGITGQPAGPYSVTAYDNQQCSATGTITINQPTALQIAGSHQDVACNGGNTGRAVAIAQGGTPPYIYSWNTTPVQNNALAVNLIAGTYTVVATDANNCTIDHTETVVEPTLLTASITDTTHNICWNGSTGNATVTGSGGSLPYTYNWDTNPAQTTAIINSLPAGTYRVTVTDDSLCTATASVVITQPTQMQIAPLVVPALCYDSTQGSITLTVTQGTPGSGTAYTYLWSPGGWGTETQTNLLAGPYDVTVYDANQCWEARSYVINQPPQLSISTEQSDASCYGYLDGTVTVLAGGGTPAYTYSLWENGSQLAANSTGTFTGLPFGNYVGQFADANGCMTSATEVVQQPTQLVIDSISADSVNCYGFSDGSIHVRAAGSVQPYTYSINNAISNNDGQFGGLTQGTYNVLITDSHNCTVTEVAIVNEPYLQILTATPDSISLKLGETKPVVITSNYDPATTYLWDNWQGLDFIDRPNVNITLYENYTYSVLVTAHPHDLDCQTRIEIPVTVIPNYDVYIPNAFSPNGDGANDFFEYYGNKAGIKQSAVQVFNRIGEKVFESDDINFKWDGYFKSVVQNPGVYVYTLKLVFFDNHTENEYKGSVTLLR